MSFDEAKSHGQPFVPLLFEQPKAVIKFGIGFPKVSSLSVSQFSPKSKELAGIEKKTEERENINIKLKVDERDLKRKKLRG